MKKLFAQTNFVLLTCLVTLGANAQTFTRVTSGPLVSDLGGFLGAAWGDYDGDGYVDLFVANNQKQNLLFHNNGNGSFSKITAGEILTDRAVSYSATWGDYDNDGDLDLFVANRGGGNFLYQNDGANFTRIKDGPIATDSFGSISASWGDYDNDGDLDLFVANVAAHNLLYQNNGNGTFTKITSGPIVTDRVVDSVVGLWGDYDNDGDIDLYVVNGWFALYANFLYRNEGNGNFTKITAGRIVTDVEGSTGGSWGDYDNDGYLDLYVCNSVNDAANSLYHNNGNGTFTKITGGDLVTDLGHSTGSSWIDYDNDGDLDLFVVNVFGATNKLYRNNGDGTFTKVTSGAIVTDANFSFGCGWADYDNDGDQDVYVTNGGISQTWRNFFYRNDGNQNQWLTIQCKGMASNTSAIGAVVRVKATIAGKAVWQKRQIAGQTGFLGQNCLSASFGLGEAVTIDSLVIDWPSGRKQVQTNIAPKQILLVTEAPSTAVTDNESAALPSEYLLSQNYPNPFSPDQTSRGAATTEIAYEIAARHAQTANVELALYNVQGQLMRTLVQEVKATGKYSATWNGLDASGRRVPSGVYFYRLKIGAIATTRRLVVLE